MHFTTQFTVSVIEMVLARCSVEHDFDREGSGYFASRINLAEQGLSIDSLLDSLLGRL